MGPYAEANAQLMHELFAALAARDRGAIASRLAADVVWATPGRSPLAGEQHGAEGVIAQLAGATELSGGTLAIDVLDIMASDDHATVYYRTTAERNGQRATLEQIALVTIVANQVTHVQQAPLDLYAYDAFWS